MSTLLIAFIMVLLIATIGSLFGGLASMGIGGAFDDRNSTRLMFARVGLQAMAIVLVLMLFVIGR
jgi:membrane protein YqaA with SNARE-associated domain